MRDINAFWIGPKLGAIHAACLASFLRFGYRVRLHIYDAPEDVPDGVELFDASSLMPRSDLVRHRRTGSYALASDKYRYRILRAGLGTYVDADVYCLKPLPHSDYLLGWEIDDRLNGAVLDAPADSAFVQYLNRVVDDPFFIPPWEKRSRRAKLHLRRRLGFKIDPARLPWGSYGPSLVTHAVKELGLEEDVLPIDAFYPVPHDRTGLLTDPELSVSDIVTHRTFAIHLYNTKLSAESVPPESPLGVMLAGRV